MKRLRIPRLTAGLTAAFACTCVVAAALYWSSVASSRAQSTTKADPASKTQSTNEAKAPTPTAPTPAPTSATAPRADQATPPAATNAPAPARSEKVEGDKKAEEVKKTDGDSAGKPVAEKKDNPDELTVSFQGAQVDMLVQWLAEKTGKSVIKHKNVNCQVTIAGSKKLTLREALNLIYRALALEGVTAIESSSTIMLVPEGTDPKMSPELISGTNNAIPEGRQRLVKIFPVKHIPPAELKDKIRPVVSEKATIDVDDRGGQLIVTDFNENLRLLVELVKELDVESVADNTIKIYAMKHADAEELGSLISLIINAQPGNPVSAYKAPSGGSRMVSSFNQGMVMMDSPPSSSGGNSGPTPGSGTTVKIWPDKAANRIIVSCAKAKLPEVERLLDILDTDKPEDMAVRTIPLKNVKAQELVREIVPLYRSMPKKGPRDTIEVAANDRSNSLIVLSSELNFRAVEKVIASLDTEDAQEKVTHTFTLKNADAQDVAKQLTDLNKDPDDNMGFARYFYYDSGMPQQKGRKLSVVADRRRNTIIVQASPTAMEGVIKMVESLDEPVSDNGLAPKIFPLKYVSATDIEDVLNELFLKKSTQRSYFSMFGDPEENTSNDRDAGRLYGKVRITSEPYSNTIIVTSNSPENLKALEDVLKQLDQPSQAGETTVRVGLQYAKANILANSLNILFAKGGAPPLRQVNQPGQPQNFNNQQQPNNNAPSGGAGNFDLELESKEDGYFPWLGGQPETTRTADGRNVTRSVSDLVGRVRVVPDPRSNSLLVSANAHFLTSVMKLVDELDVPTASVTIEARIVEVSSDFLDKIGVRWSPNGSQVFSAADYENSFLAHGSVNQQNGFGGLTTVNNTTTTTGAGGNSLMQALTSIRSGTLSSSISMDFLVQFLKQNTDAAVLAEPQINIEDNELGKLFVGQQVPYTLNSVNSPGVGNINTSANYGYKDVGIKLEVTPHINTSGDVALRIHAESSSILPGQVLNGSPYIDTRQFKTDVTAKNGETLVLGGIIQKQVSDTLRKTPILGDIPGLKWAFNKKDKSVREVELLVFLRPKVVRNPADARKQLEDSQQKAPLIKQWEETGSLRDQKSKKK